MAVPRPALCFGLNIFSPYIESSRRAEPFSGSASKAKSKQFLDFLNSPKRLDKIALLVQIGEYIL